MKRLICLLICFLLLILPACSGEQGSAESTAAKPIVTQPAADRKGCERLLHCGWRRSIRNLQ